MTNKEISRKADRIFKSALPVNWAIRDQQDQEDYGIDSEIELTDSSDRATGTIFKIQLKGVENAQISKEGELIYNHASVPRFRYYIEDVSIPTIFIVCNLETETCYWIRIQGNRIVEDELKAANEKGQKTFTLRIPSFNTLTSEEASALRLIKAVGESSDSITLNKIQYVPAQTIANSFGDSSEAEAWASQLKILTGMALNEKMRHLLIEGKYFDALNEADTIFRSESELPELRICAAIAIVHALTNIEIQEKRPAIHQRMAAVRLGMAADLVKIARDPKCPKHIRLHTISYIRSARLHASAEAVKALLITERNEIMADAFLNVTSESQRIEATNRVRKEFLALRRITFRAAARGHHFLIPYIWAEWSNSTSPFMWALRFQGKDDLTRAYLGAIDAFFPTCVQIIATNQSHGEIYRIFTNIGLGFISLSDLSSADQTTARFNALREHSTPFLGVQPINEALKDIEEIARLTDDNHEPTVDQIKAYYIELAVSLGINLDDANDKIANIVRVGLHDLDPTRIAKKCSHIHIYPTAQGLPARMLGLPTAGFKRIVCLKHGHGLEGFELDRTYDLFSKDLPFLNPGRVSCSACKDTDPLPDGWQWNEEWEEKQRQRFRVLQIDSEQGGLNW